MNPDNTLVVPIDVDVLCLGASSGEAQFRGPAHDFKKIDARNYHASKVGRFPEWKPKKSDQGVHLHWKLPPPLTRGTMDQDGKKVSFRPAPDRWLVVRLPEEELKKGTSGPRGSESKGSAPAMWVVESDFCSRDYASWHGSAIPVDPAHASAGKVYLGRAVDLARWVDRGERASLAKVTGGHKLTALGWGDPAFAAYYPGCRNVFGMHDPLEGVKQGSFSYLVVGWYRDADDDPVVTAKSLEELGWSAAPGFKPGRCVLRGMVKRVTWPPPQKPGIPPAKVRIEVRDNLQECLAQLSGKGQEWLLEQAGASNKAPHEAAATLHARRFSPRSGGDLWVTRPPEEKPGSPPPGAAPSRATADLEKALVELNRVQRRHDEALRAQACLQRRVQHGWLQLLQLTWTPEAERRELPVEASDLSAVRVALRRRIQRDRDDLHRADARVIELGEACAQKKKALGDQGYRIPAPRFWRPNDPVVLVHDEAIRAPSRRRLLDRESTLACQDVRKASPTLPGIFDDLAGALRRLPHEDVCRRLITSAVAFAGTQELVAGGGVFDPEAWSPLYLRWTARYTPAVAVSAKLGSYPGNTLCAGGPPGAAKNGVDLKVPSAQDRHHHWIEGVSLVDLDQPRRTGAPVAGREKMASHSLDGFHDALLMLRPDLHLPFGAGARVLHVDEIDDLPSDGTRPEMRDELFSPLRAGRLELRRLEHVDELGRARVLFDAEVGAPSMDLPPRLGVPARLSFRLKSRKAREDDASHDLEHGSPVLGWLVRSHLDRSVVFCDSEGTPTDVLRVEAGQKRREPAPGSAGGEKTAPAAQLVRRICDELEKKPVDFLDNFLDAIDAEVSSIVPENSRGGGNLGMLIGRPLAIVRADLELELYGRMPPRNQAPRIEAQADEDLKLGEVELPVQLGDPRRNNDGLVGFFVEPEKSAPGRDEYGVFHTPTFAIHEGDKRGAKRPESYLPLRLHKRVRLLMLVDPAAPVHATTGILPMKAVALQRAHYQYSLDKLGVLFPCGPVLLAEGGGFPVPLPEVSQHVWRWRGASGAGAGWQDAHPAGASTLPRATGLVSEAWLSLTARKREP